MNLKCARCNKPVERIELYENIRQRTLEIKVWCHGEEDTCTITEHFMIEALAPLKEGVAFNTRKLK